MTTTSTTKLGLNGTVMEFTTTQTFQGPAEVAPLPDSTPAPVAATQPGPVQKSQILFLSDAGQCEVYLDGKKVADMGVGMVDEAVEARVRDLKPSTYRVKVVSFNNVWYEGKLTVGTGESLKIQIEPQSFDIISRDPLP